MEPELNNKQLNNSPSEDQPDWLESAKEEKKEAQPTPKPEKAEQPKPGEVVKPENWQEEKEEEPKEPQEKVTPKEEIGEQPLVEKEKPKSKPKKEKPKFNVKGIVWLLVILVALGGLFGGGYYLYNSGMVDGLIERSLNMVSEQAEEEVTQPDETVVEESQPKEQSTTSLDYIEKQLVSLEDNVDEISRNYRLGEFINLENSDF